MPECHVSVRWPDGAAEDVYSPSTVVGRHFAVGASYPVGEFVDRSRAALRAASHRVEARYGKPCSSAAASLRAVEARAAGFDRGEVTVEGIG